MRNILLKYSWGTTQHVIDLNVKKLFNMSANKLELDTDSDNKLHTIGFRVLYAKYTTI